MGEFADYANERWADGEWDETDVDEMEGPLPRTKTCRHCGQGGFSWLFVDGAGWRLADDKGVHRCPKFMRK